MTRRKWNLVRRYAAAFIILALASPLIVVAMPEYNQYGRKRYSDPLTNQSLTTTNNGWVVNNPCDQSPADTIAGPSIPIEGARMVHCLVRANSGRCSLFTFQVSMNDTNWQTGGTTLNIIHEIANTDSLNQGGQIAVLMPWDGSSSLYQDGTRIGWRFCRALFTPLGDAADQNCNSRVDSLRFSYRVYWN